MSNMSLVSKMDLKLFPMQIYTNFESNSQRHTVVHLDDTKRSDGSYDILLDGHKADLKTTKSANNIVKYGKDAINKQKAEIVVFKFDKMDTDKHIALNKLAKQGIHGYYIEEDNGKLIRF